MRELKCFSLFYFIFYVFLYFYVFFIYFFIFFKFLFLNKTKLTQKVHYQRKFAMILMGHHTFPNDGAWNILAEKVE